MHIDRFTGSPVGRREARTFVPGAMDLPGVVPRRGFGADNPHCPA